MFKPQSLSKYCPFDAIHLSTVFPELKQFLNWSILMPFSASAIFLFHFFHVSKMFPLEEFFHPGKQKNFCLG